MAEARSVSSLSLRVDDDFTASAATNQPESWYNKSDEKVDEKVEGQEVKVPAAGYHKEEQKKEVREQTEKQSAGDSGPGTGPARSLHSVPDPVPGAPVRRRCLEDHRYVNQLQLLKNLHSLHEPFLPPLEENSSTQAHVFPISFQAIIQVYNSPWDLTVMPAEKGVQLYELIMKALNAQRNIKILRNMCIDEACCARWSEDDPNLYRARVVGFEKIADGDGPENFMMTLYFVDWGNYAEVPRNQVFELPVGLLKWWPLAVKCRLQADGTANHYVDWSAKRSWYVDAMTGLLNEMNDRITVTLVGCNEGVYTAVFTEYDRLDDVMDLDNDFDIRKYWREDICKLYPFDVFKRQKLSCSDKDRYRRSNVIVKEVDEEDEDSFEEGMMPCGYPVPSASATNYESDEEKKSYRLEMAEEYDKLLKAMGKGKGEGPKRKGPWKPNMRGCEVPPGFTLTFEPRIEWLYIDPYFEFTVQYVKSSREIFVTHPEFMCHFRCMQKHLADLYGETGAFHDATLPTNCLRRGVGCIVQVASGTFEGRWLRAEITGYCQRGSAITLWSVDAACDLPPVAWQDRAALKMVTDRRFTLNKYSFTIASPPLNLLMRQHELCALDLERHELDILRDIMPQGSRIGLEFITDKKGHHQKNKPYRADFIVINDTVPMKDRVRVKDLYERKLRMAGMEVRKVVHEKQRPQDMRNSRKELEKYWGFKPADFKQVIDWEGYRKFHNWKEVLITHIESPTEIYFQPMEMVTPIVDMTRDLNDEYEILSQFESIFVRLCDEQIRPGVFCAAKYPQGYSCPFGNGDGLWYRAMITRVRLDRNNDPQHVTIKYIDYGNSIHFDLDKGPKLFPLRDHFAEYPKGAMRGILRGFLTANNLGPHHPASNLELLRSTFYPAQYKNHWMARFECLNPDEMINRCYVIDIKDFQGTNAVDHFIAHCNSILRGTANGMNGH